MTTSPIDQNEILAVLNAAPAEHRVPVQEAWHPKAIEILLTLGWTVEDLTHGPNAGCSKHPLIYASRKKARQRDDAYRQTTYLELFANEHATPTAAHGITWEETQTIRNWRSIRLDLTKPRVVQSAVRWMSATVFGLSETMGKVAAALNRRAREQQLGKDYVAGLLAGTGFTQEEIANRFGSLTARYVDDSKGTAMRLFTGSLMLSCKRGWTDETKVHRLCNLLTFLRQEGWDQ